VDGSRFDQLAKTMAGGSRRTVLKAGLGAALGAALGGIGIGGADAAKLRRVGEICRKNGDCASHACLPKDRTGRRRCGECLTAADCVAPAGNDQCYGATCVAGFCDFGIRVGEVCDDGSLCTAESTCQENGACLGTPISCDPPGQCQLEGFCNPQTGDCDYSNKPNDTPCDTGVPNSSGATCQDGTCVCTPSGTDCGTKECGSGFTTCGQPVSCGECGVGKRCKEDEWICAWDHPGCRHRNETCDASDDCCDGECVDGYCESGPE
jgi:hypothetical protein